MKYAFPINVNLRKFLPSAEKVLGSVESNFKSFTGESIGLVVTSQIMEFTVNTPLPLNSDQLKLVHATLMPLLLEHFPNMDVEIGEPKITE